MALNNLPDYIIDKLTEQVAVQTYCWIYRKEESPVTIDLVNPRNHRPFLEHVYNITRDISRKKVFRKNIVVGFLRKNFTKGKETYFYYNQDFDAISILVKYNILEDIGGDKFKIN
jgi:hypothetical protein